MEPRRDPPEGIPIPFAAPVWGIRGSEWGKGGYRLTLPRPVLGYRRGTATLGRVARYLSCPDLGHRRGVAVQGSRAGRGGKGGGSLIDAAAAKTPAPTI